MAAVQRTRIGYGNEGRTKQLAASLSDLIRLFSLYRPASPNKTTHQISCCALLAGGGGCLPQGDVSTPLSLLKCTGSGRSAPISALRPARQSVSHLHDLRGPTEVQKVCFSFSSSLLSSRTLFIFSFPHFSAGNFCVCARRELRVKRTKRC